MGCTNILQRDNLFITRRNNNSIKQYLQHGHSSSVFLNVILLLLCSHIYHIKYIFVLKCPCEKLRKFQPNFCANFYEHLFFQLPNISYKSPNFWSMKDDLQILKVEYLTNRLLDHTQILNLSLYGQTIFCKSFK